MSSTEMSGPVDQHPPPEAPPGVGGPEPGGDSRPDGPPHLHGPSARLSRGFLFGLHAFQVAADLNAVARGLRPSAWPFGLGPDAAEAHAWLASTREKRDAVERSIRVKLERHGEDDVDRHLTPRERGAAVARVVAEVVAASRPTRPGDQSAAVRAALVAEQFDEDGRIVGPPLTDHAAAFLLSIRLITPAESDRWKAEGHGHPYFRPVRVEPSARPSPMRGTPNQVAWALKIRVALRPRIEDYVARRRSEPDADPGLLDRYSKVVGGLAQASASWWIENRFRAVADIVEDSIRAIPGGRESAL